MSNRKGEKMIIGMLDKFLKELKKEQQLKEHIERENDNPDSVFYTGDKK